MPSRSWNAENQYLLLRESLDNVNDSNENRQKLADELREMRNSETENPDLARANAQEHLEDVKINDDSYADDKEKHQADRDFKLNYEILKPDLSKYVGVGVQHIFKDAPEVSEALKNGYEPAQPRSILKMIRNGDESPTEETKYYFPFRKYRVTYRWSNSSW